MDPASHPLWQRQLPRIALSALAAVEAAGDAWKASFPPKSAAQKELEGQVWWGVMTGALNWAALDDVKQGQSISFDKMADTSHEDSDDDDSFFP